MKRKRVIIGTLLVLLMVGGTAYLLWENDNITRASWEMLHMGMTEKEVEGILGGPGMSDKEFRDHYERLMAKGHLAPDEPSLLTEGDWEAGNGKLWLGQRGIMGVTIENGAVRAKMFVELRSIEPNVIERLLDWLGW